MSMTARLVLIAGTVLVAGCGSTAQRHAMEAPAIPPAAQTQTPTQARGDRFSPFGVSGAGLIANRPIDITQPAPSTLARGGTFKPNARHSAPAATVQTSVAAKPTSAPDTAALNFNPRASARPEASPVATTFYGQVMAKAMNPQASDDALARGGGVNVMQVSFATEGADFDPIVTPDGARLIFSSTQHRPTADIYVKDIDGRTVTQLTTDPANDIMPAVSPDGTRIAFASNRSGVWNLYVMPIDGGRAVQITSTSSDDLHPSWSPDGRQLVFSRLGQMSGQWEMWVTDVGTTSVAKFIGYGLFPEWSPRAGTGPQGGDLIAFQRSRERGDRSFGIWTLEIKNGQAGNTTEVASSPVAACINPTWSPDGQWIAFATVPNAAEWAAKAADRPDQADLWMVDNAGQSRINLTSGLALNLMPTFGPNNRVFFVSDRGGLDNIWSMDTSAVVQLAELNMNRKGGTAVAERRSTPARQAAARTPVPTPLLPTVADVPEHDEPGEP